jgi:arylformamidase
MPGNHNWIDVSVPLRTGMAHWPGDPEPNFERICEIEQGEEANVTFCRMSAHTGTHMDAPCHFLAGRSGIDSFPLEVGIGPARVIAVTDSDVISGSDLQGKGIKAGDRVLLKTLNSGKRWQNLDFQTDFVGIDSSGAKFLAEAGIALVGIDYLSVGVFKGDGRETHTILLQAGIWILEGLNLSEVNEGAYDLICLPLRIEGSDGSPARAILRPL